ncbi:MAG: aromatic amino acid lyase [Fibrobacteraceae bacterium]|nr:aromatic amino acid lyase [Fibrobacteraceae bacterium]
MKPTVVIGKDRLTIENVVAIAKQTANIVLNDTQEFADKIDAGAKFLDEALAEHGGIYGVTTGYGDSCTQTVKPENYYDLPVNLTRFHGCGLGEYFDPETTRAIVAVRLNTLAQGFSGVSMDLLRIITQFLQNDILPLIPQEGSVGASGDLTPLSYLAGAIIGERKVLYKGEVRQSLDVMKELGITPHKFRPKEAIAIMNGTAAMNGVACLAYSRAEYLADLSCRITAMNTIAMKGNAYHFFERLFDVKPHPGQNRSAKEIRDAMAIESTNGIVPEKIQDPYSLRCAPHVIGMFYEAEELIRRLIETEMNSANDNPIVDPFTRSIFHGGHFYGGHICFAMDSLKNIVANIADLLDRQLATIVDIKTNRNLPPNLSCSGEFAINHGFKAVQIGVSSWTAEALHKTMPLSVFSRSTECHNQDKVSMGTIAARDCLRVIELTEQVTAAVLLAAAQAIHIRLDRGELGADRIEGVKETYNQVFANFKLLECDRQLEGDLRNTIKLIREKYYSA